MASVRLIGLSSASNPTSLLLLGGLRHRIRTVEQEDGDLFIRVLSDIDRPVNTGAGFLPIDLSRRDLNAQALTAIAVFNREEIAAQYYGDAMAGITVPQHSLTESKTQSSHHRGSVMKEEFVNHGALGAWGRSDPFPFRLPAQVRHPRLRLGKPIP